MKKGIFIFLAINACLINLLFASPQSDELVKIEGRLVSIPFEADLQTGEFGKTFTLFIYSGKKVPSKLENGTEEDIPLIYEIKRANITGLDLKKGDNVTLYAILTRKATFKEYYNRCYESPDTKYSKMTDILKELFNYFGPEIYGTEIYKFSNWDEIFINQRLAYVAKVKDENRDNSINFIKKQKEMEFRLEQDKLKQAEQDKLIENKIKNINDEYESKINKEKAKINEIKYIFPLVSKMWGATIIKIEGKNTSKALAVGEVNFTNAKEYCDRDPGGETLKYGGKLTDTQLIDKILNQEKGKLHYISADCETRTLANDFGSFTLIGQTPDKVNIWRDNTSGKILEPGGANNTDVLDAQFQLLCPACVIP